MRQEKNEKKKQRSPSQTEQKEAGAPAAVQGKSKVNRKAPVFTPPDFKRHVYRDYPLDLLLPYINLQMLFGKHLGLKGNVEQLIKEGDEKALEIKDV